MSTTVSGAETVRIESIAAGGRGVARLSDGRVTFVSRAAPGDLLEIAVTRDQGRWTESAVVRVVEEGPARRDAPCPYYARCGGCSLQHLDYDAQREAKGVIIEDALRRLGGWKAGSVDVVAAPGEWRYRNRMTFTLRRLPGGRVVAGLYDREARGRVVDVDHRCLLPSPALIAAWAALRRNWGGGASRLPRGRELRLTLREDAEGRVFLVIDGGASGGEPAALIGAAPALAGVWQRPRGSDETRCLAVDDALPATDMAFHAANAFSQVHPAASALLEAYVFERMAPSPGNTVVDAYAGDGAHARAAAAAGATAIAIERDPAAAARCEALSPDVDVRVGDVELRLPGALPASVLVVNPPRAGLSEEAVAIIRGAPPERLLYVSCDPATLARDIARLEGAFSPRHARGFDLFPQTAHVETVVELCATT